MTTQVASTGVNATGGFVFSWSATLSEAEAALSGSLAAVLSAASSATLSLPARTLPSGRAATFTLKVCCYYQNGPTDVF